MGARSSKVIASTPVKPPPPEASSRRSFWSDLPPEIAGLVLGRLTFLADRVRFASVCRHWRHAVQQQAPALPHACPWIISFCGRTYQSIQDGDVHPLSRPSGLTVCRGSSENWLLLTRPWPPEKRNFLENPLSGAPLPLPAKLYPDGGDDDNGFPEVQKFIVFSSNLVVATTVSSWSTGRDPLVACCRPGMSSWSTSSHGAGGGESFYEDIAFYRGNIYAITIRGDLFTHEVSMDDNGDGETTVSPAKQVIRGDNDTPDSRINRFLVVSSRGNKLLMVNHEKCYGFSGDYVFKVFEADVEISRWSQVASIGDQVLFLSRRCSKAVPSSSHDDYLCGDRIYFVDHKLYGPEKCRCRSGLASCGMFDFRDNTYHPIVSDVHRLGDLTAWFFPRK